jgi:hypothetical protein
MIAENSISINFTGPPTRFLELRRGRLTLQVGSETDCLEKRLMP